MVREWAVERAVRRVVMGAGRGPNAWVGLVMVPLFYILERPDRVM